MINSQVKLRLVTPHTTQFPNKLHIGIDNYDLFSTRASSIYRFLFVVLAWILYAQRTNEFEEV